MNVLGGRAQRAEDVILLYINKYILLNPLYYLIYKHSEVLIMHLLVFTISYFHLHFQFYFHYIARIKRKIFRINIYKNYYRIYVVLYTFILNILKGYYFDFIIYWSMKDIHKSLQSVSDQLIQMKGSWCNWPSSSHIDRMLSELQNSILHDQDNTLSSTDHTTPHTEAQSVFHSICARSTQHHFKEEEWG